MKSVSYLSEYNINFMVPNSLAMHARHAGVDLSLSNQMIEARVMQ